MGDSMLTLAAKLTLGSDNLKEAWVLTEFGNKSGKLLEKMPLLRRFIGFGIVYWR